MKLRYLLLTVSTVGCPTVAYAQPISGLYVGAGAGANFMPVETNEIALPFRNREIVLFNNASSDTGWAAVASAGYGLGNGLRFEVEGDYRYNSQFSNGNTYDGRPNREQKYGGMANALFDFTIGVPYVYPYVGVGAGYMHVDRLLNLPSNGVFAYQAIAGAALPIAVVPGLSATLEYRFMGLAGSTASDGASFKYANDYNNAIMIGLRFAFNSQPPAQAVVAAPAAVPAPAPARSYLVFFDWDKAELTDRARQIVRDAAQASTRVQTTRIEVQGYADRSGAPDYNQKLSLRRAEAVAAELVRDGVPRAELDIQAFGDTHPLVPTAAGVREPQNRRVVIILR